MCVRYTYIFCMPKYEWNCKNRRCYNSYKLLALASIVKREKFLEVLIVKKKLNKTNFSNVIYIVSKKKFVVRTT